jgi:hypothetical protein
MLPGNSNECPLDNRSHRDAVADEVAAAGLISSGINKGFVGWFDNW